MKNSEHAIKVPRIYKVASKIAKTVKEEGRSLKDLVFNNKKHTNVKGVYALIFKTLKNEDVLDRLINESKILVKEEKADPWLIRVLITELLFGKKILPGDSKPVQTVLSYRNVLLAALKNAEKAGIVSLDSNQNQGTIPRYVRVNTLIISVADALKHFQNEGWKLIPKEEITDYQLFLKRTSSLAEDEFIEDHHIKELLIFPNKTEFFQHELYLNGSIILQDKASCLASWLLNPSPGSTTLDLCAAPGMKTTHLGAIMQNKGTLHAVEMDSGRYKTLCKQIEKCGVKCVETHHQDAIKIDAKICQGVEFILIDPSCSGSGMVSRLKVPTKEITPERIKKLARFQIKLLCHALTNFPNVKRVVYSTCSLNVEENEQVVARALEVVNSDPENPFFKVADNMLEDKWLHRGSEDYEWGPRCVYSRPDVDLTNGFFIAVLDRVRDAVLDRVRDALQKNEDNSQDEPKKKVLKASFETKRKRFIVKSGNKMLKKTNRFQKSRKLKCKRESDDSVMKSDEMLMETNQLQKSGQMKRKRESNDFQTPELKQQKEKKTDE